MTASPRLLSTILLLLVLVLGACSTLERKPLGRHLPTPAEAVTQTPAIGRVMEWGGLIVDSHNRRDAGELVILAYPLDGDGRPDLQARPQGRFLARRPGYLETLDYAPGRAVTVSGPLSGLRDSTVGDLSQHLPQVDIERIILWEQASPRYEQPRLHFGISGGSRGSNVGIGIGF